MILHQVQRGEVKTTEGSTDIKFDMPYSEEMHVSFHGTCDPRIKAAYAFLFANLPMLMDQPIAQLRMVGERCNVEFVG